MNLNSQLFEIGKKAGRLHLVCLAGYVSECCTPRMLSGTIKELYTGLRAAPGLRLGQYEYRIFESIHLRIVLRCSFCPISGEPVVQRRRKSAGITKALESGIDFIQAVSSEIEQGGREGFDFFHAGVLFSLLEALFGQSDMSRPYGDITRQFGESLSCEATCKPPPSIWILPGEGDFFASGFDIGKIKMSEDMLDVFRSAYPTYGKASGFTKIDFQWLDSGILALAQKAKRCSPEIFPGKMVFTLRIPKNQEEEEWCLDVEHDRNPNQSVISVPATFGKFTIGGETKIRTLIDYFSKVRIPVLEPASDEDMTKYIHLKQRLKPGKTKSKTDNKYKAFRDFCNGLKVDQEKIEEAGLSGPFWYFSKWINDNHVEKITLHIEEEP